MPHTTIIKIKRSDYKKLPAHMRKKDRGVEMVLSSSGKRSAFVQVELIP